MLPDTFLLHNREFLKIWNNEESRKELRRFFAEGAPVISMGKAEHLCTFANHHQASTDTHNPSVITAEIRGREFAVDLDDITRGAEFRTYEHVERLHAFPDLFLKEAKRVHLDPEIAERTLLEAKRISDEEKGAPFRHGIDGYSGVTRSGLIRLFRAIPAKEIRNREAQIWECARLAYARNIALPLQYPWQESQTPIIHHDQLDRAVVYELREESDILERLRWSSGSEPYQIDWRSVQCAPWSQIRAIVDDKNSPAKEFLRCKRNLLAVPSYGNLEAFAKALIVYLKYLVREFRAPGSLSPTVLRLLPLATYLVVTLACEPLEVNLRATIAVILATYLVESRLATARSRESETDAQNQTRGAIHLLASHRWPEDHDEQQNQQS